MKELLILSQKVNCNKQYFLVIFLLGVIFSNTSSAFEENSLKVKHQKAANAQKYFGSAILNPLEMMLKKADKPKISLLETLTANSGSCTIGGGKCSFDHDCCSDNCYDHVCQAGSGSCTIGGGKCSFDNDCCSGNCYDRVCQTGSNECKADGYNCSSDANCCDGNCYKGVCQRACSGLGERCRYDSECCAGLCNSDGRCGTEPDCKR